MGIGEIVRYLGTHGSARVRGAVLLAPIPPFLLRTDDNPRGIDQAVFAAVSAAIVADRPAYLEALLDEASNADVLGRTRISEQARRTGRGDHPHRQRLRPTAGEGDLDVVGLVRATGSTGRGAWRSIRPTSVRCPSPRRRNGPRPPRRRSSTRPRSDGRGRTRAPAIPSARGPRRSCGTSSGPSGRAVPGPRPPDHHRRAAHRDVLGMDHSSESSALAQHPTAGVRRTHVRRDETVTSCDTHPLSAG